MGMGKSKFGRGRQAARRVWEWRCLGTPCGLTRTWEHTDALTSRGYPSLTSQTGNRGRERCERHEEEQVWDRSSLLVNQRQGRSKK